MYMHTHTAYTHIQTHALSLSLSLSLSLTHTHTHTHRMLLRSLSGSQEDKCLVPLTIELRPTFDKSKDVYYGFLLPVTEVVTNLTT